VGSTSKIKIFDRLIDPEKPCFVIAEAGINHSGDLDLACALIERAARAGADAVKFQTYKADLVISANAPKAAYQLANTDPGESQLNMARDIGASETLNPEHLVALRPGTGIPPDQFDAIVGHTTAIALSVGHMLRRQDLT